MDSEPLGDWFRSIGIGGKITGVLLVTILVAGSTVGAVYIQQERSEKRTERLEIAKEQSVLAQRMAFYAARIARGEGGKVALNRTMARYEENLRILETGATVNGTAVGPVSPDARDELNRTRRQWEEFEPFARTLVREEPYNPSFQSSLRELQRSERRLTAQTDNVSAAYRAANGSYATQQLLLERLQTLGSEITAAGLQVSRTDGPQYGTDVRYRNRIRALAEEYERLLSTLRTGGTYDNETIGTPPPTVEAELQRLDSRWRSYREHAITVAETDRRNPAFWQSLDFVDIQNAELQDQSNALATEMGRIAERKRTQLRQLLIGLFVIDLLVAIAGVVWVRRRVAAPLAVVTKKADAIAHGDLDVELSSVRRRDEIGALISSFGQMRDNLQQLFSELQFIEQLVEQSGVGIAAYTDDGVIQYANPAYASLLDRSRSEVVGAHVWEVNPNVNADLFDRYWDSFETGETRQIETVHTTGDRRKTPVEVFTTEIEIDGEAYHVSTIKDITARKERDQRIAVLNRVLRHNLRNKLTVILSGIKFAEQKLPESDFGILEDAMDAANKMVRISEKARMVDETLTEQEEEQGRYIAFRDVVNTPLREVQDRFPDARIETDFEDEIWVRADRFIEFAVEELLTNAIEHNDADEPTVWFSASASETDANRVVMAVEDNGPGIPETEYKILSEPDSITDLKHGSGLGLWMVNWIARRIDGRLSIEEREPTGTRVTLSVPGQSQVGSPLADETQQPAQ